jgi:hypothetical protein
MLVGFQVSAIDMERRSAETSEQVSICIKAPAIALSESTSQHGDP